MKNKILNVKKCIVEKKSLQNNLPLMLKNKTNFIIILRMNVNVSIIQISFHEEIKRQQEYKFFVAQKYNFSKLNFPVFKYFTFNRNCF